MARFIVHTIPIEATQDEVIAATKAVVNALPKDTEWLMSWTVQEGDRLFCEWDAPKEADIRAALKGAELFPVEAIYPVAAIDPAWFIG